jgi:hypothetical protein
MTATITIHHFTDNEVLPVIGRIGHTAITIDLGTIDPVTGLPNRMTFEVNVEAWRTSVRDWTFLGQYGTCLYLLLRRQPKKPRKAATYVDYLRWAPPASSR